MTEKKVQQYSYADAGVDIDAGNRLVDMVRPIVQKTFRTGVMTDIWKAGLAKGLSAEANPFDEFPERIWSDNWLFYANTVRFASAMAGGGDYGVFAGGRYALSGNIAELVDWLKAQKGQAK